MAEFLRNLVNIRSFSLLQERIERWNQTYKRNSYDENVANACELIELNARVQSQLFKLLSLCAAEGDLLGSHSAAIRDRLEPLLGSEYFSPAAAADPAGDNDDDDGEFTTGCLSADAVVSVIANAGVRSHRSHPPTTPVASAPRRFKIDEFVGGQPELLDQLEYDLRLMRRANDGIRAELAETRAELDRQARVSAEEKKLADAEIDELTARLAKSEAENDRLRARIRIFDGYDKKVQRLQDELKALQQQQQRQQQKQHQDREQKLLEQEQQERRPQQSRPITATPNRGVRRQAPITDGTLSATVDKHLAQRGPPPEPQSPLAMSHPWQQSRQQYLVARFNEVFTAARAEAMEALRCCYDDHENNQRIVYAAVVESFNAAKVAFRAFKARIRSHLLARRVGPESLEEVVQDFINCHTDLYDLHALVQDVLSCLSRNSRLYLPPGIGYDVIASFVAECCRIAWEMTALAHPLDVAVGYDGELFDDYRYRRSHDSEFAASAVSHHIWPALMQGSGLLMKGEACTRRSQGASRNTTRQAIGAAAASSNCEKPPAGRRSRSRSSRAGGGGGGSSGSKPAAALKRRPASASRPLTGGGGAASRKK